MDYKKQVEKLGDLVSALSNAFIEGNPAFDNLGIVISISVIGDGVDDFIEENIKPGTSLTNTAEVDKTDTPSNNQILGETKTQTTMSSYAGKTKSQVTQEKIEEVKSYIAEKMDFIEKTNKFSEDTKEEKLDMLTDALDLLDEAFEKAKEAYRLK